MPPRRFRAPAGDGEVLADPPFARVPELVERNRRILDTADVVIGGLPLRELRKQARREVLGLARAYSHSPGTLLPGLSPDAPLLLAGHQPELAHPGVWVKNFALNGLARKLDGVPLNLIVDNDTLKSTSLRFPLFFDDHDPESVRLDSAQFDFGYEEIPYEYALIRDIGTFNLFPDRVTVFTRNWPFTPLLADVWPRHVPSPIDSTNPWLWFSERFTTARTAVERRWGGGNEELLVSRLAGSESFRRFTRQLMSDAPRFATAYNTAVRRYRVANRLRSTSHPVPDLTQLGDWIELPFWGQQHGANVITGRGRVFVKADGTAVRVNADTEPGVSVDDAVRSLRLRPRALTLTLFSRLCLGDFFIHGIGGGKYDEVTDAIIRDYFGLEPPAYQVLSATLHLPLPAWVATADDVKRLERLERDLRWNPHRHLPDAGREHDALAASEPPDAAGRKARYRAFRRLADELRPRVADQLADVRRRLERARQEVRANAVLRRRDYSWVLYPEEVLKPFVQRFLEI